MRSTLLLTIACAIATDASAQERLTPAEISDAIALGADCGDVPLIRVGSPRGDFHVFIEGPFARVAVQAAAARQMRVPFGIDKVTPDLTAPDHRIWLQYNWQGRRTVSVSRVLLRPLAARRETARIESVGEGRATLHVGHLPAHGILDDIRWRRYVWVFNTLPAGKFEVILVTSAGLQRYTVTEQDRASVMRVCT